MRSRLELRPATTLIGMCRTMSFAQNTTAQLWQSFMTRRSEIDNPASPYLYSAEVYPHTTFFQQFDPTALFQKWAAVEVGNVYVVPEGMTMLQMPEGLYAVFTHVGPATDGEKTYRYIFQTWLPSSGYVLDNRPHFALMGEKYKHNDAKSEEEIWIPIIH